MKLGTDITMFIIGITGGSGAGKTSALRALQTFGAKVLDCDELYHKILSDNGQMKAGLEERFTGVLVDGVIDRKRLGGIVFNDAQALADLNKLTHKYIGRETTLIIKQWEEQGARVAAIDAIALLQSRIADVCNVTVGVLAPMEKRIARIMKRDTITREKAILRINAQMPDGFYEENCDYILMGDNEKSEEFEEKCKCLFKRILEEHKIIF